MSHSTNLYDMGPLTLAKWLLYRAYKFHSPLDNDLGVEGSATQKQKKKNMCLAIYSCCQKWPIF